MPTSRELVSNKALTGTELAHIIVTDVTRMTESNGLLNSQMAFPRVTYDLRLTLHLEVPSMPISTEHVQSRELEPFPLADAPGAVIHATELTREIASPNVARIEHSLPVDVAVIGQDGHQIEQQIQYPKSAVEGGFAEPDLSDVSDAVRKELGL